MASSSSLSTSVSSSATATATATTAILVSLSASLTQSATASPATSLRPGEGIELAPGNAVVNFILGLLVITASSIMNSFGLNLMQYDHLRTLPLNPQPPEYLRPLWVAGFGSYLVSQIFGSTLALRYLRAEYCAPLSSSSLVFNFVFARYLLGTPVSRRDLQGTGLIIIAVVLIVILGSINSGLSTSITLDRLYRLWARPAFLIYFILQTLFLIGGWLTVLHLSLLAENRGADEDVVEEYLCGPPFRYFPRWNPLLKTRLSYLSLQRKLSDRLMTLTARLPDSQLTFFVGIGWGAVGGILSGASLIATKTVVMLGLGEGNVYWHPTPLFTIVILAVTAVLQMLALNRALKAYSSTVVVPVFFSGYTLLGFANSMVFLDQIAAYSWTVLVLIALSIGVLLSGVVLLSMPKDLPADETTPSSPTGDATSTTADAALRHRSASTSAGAAEEGRAQTLFDEDDERSGLRRSEEVDDEEGAKWEIGSEGSAEEGEKGVENPWDRDPGAVDDSADEREGLNRR